MRDCLSREVKYRTSRSSGAGGQHVNKTETRVELLWLPRDSACLKGLLRQRVIMYLGKRLDGKGMLRMVSEKYRSQARNKEEVFERFMRLILLAMLPPRKRVATRIPRRVQEERLRRKKNRGVVKQNRRRPSGEE